MDTELINSSKEAISQMEKLLGEMAAIQPRSNFALEHFVICQHDTPGRQRQQILSELQALMFALADMNDDVELAQFDLENIQDSDRGRIERRKLERQIYGIQISIQQRLKEVNFLLSMLERLPVYSAEEFEAEEPEYWQKRLTRQVFFAQHGDNGNLDAILQMASQPGIDKPVLPLKLEDIFSLLGLDPAKFLPGNHG